MFLVGRCVSASATDSDGLEHAERAVESVASVGVFIGRCSSRSSGVRMDSGRPVPLV